MKKVLFSIIVPVYNAEEYISRCLNSILECRESDIEIILVNDGSSDDSQKICEEYRKKDKRISLINQKNQGVSAARNQGINYASGKYILFLDSDDYLVPHYYELLCQAVMDDFDFIGMSNYCFHNNKVFREDYPIEKAESEDLLDAQKILMGTHLLHTCWGKIYKKEILQKSNVKFPLGVKIGEDYLFVLRYFKYVKRAKLINKPLLFYCINSDSVMQNYQVTQRYEAWEMLVKFCWEYYCNENYDFDHNFSVYQLKNTTSFLYDLCKNCSLSESAIYIRKILDNVYLNKILLKINSSQLDKMKYLEYKLLYLKKCNFLLGYFKIKSRFPK